VIVSVGQALPWLHVSTNATREKLWKLLNPAAPLTFGVDDACVDQTSSALRNGKEVVAKVVRGVDDGERVFFLDVCIRDVK
jgi:hypothetical protein